MLAPGQRLWAMARDVLSPQALRADGRLRYEVVDALFAEQEARPSDGTSLALWALMSHQMWRSEFFGPSAGAHRGTRELVVMAG